MGASQRGHRAGGARRGGRGAGGARTGTVRRCVPPRRPAWPPRRGEARAMASGPEEPPVGPLQVLGGGGGGARHENPRGRRSKGAGRDGTGRGSGAGRSATKERRR